MHSPAPFSTLHESFQYPEQGKRVYKYKNHNSKCGLEFRSLPTRSIKSDIAVTDSRENACGAVLAPVIRRRGARRPHAPELLPGVPVHRLCPRLPSAAVQPRQAAAVPAAAGQPVRGGAPAGACVRNSPANLPATVHATAATTPTHPTSSAAICCRQTGEYFTHLRGSCSSNYNFSQCRLPCWDVTDVNVIKVANERLFCVNIRMMNCAFCLFN